VWGTVAGELINIYRPTSWYDVTSDNWDQLKSDWEQTNLDRAGDGLDPLEFVDWLADPSNFSGWAYPYSTYGLGLEPTFHVRPTTGVNYLWSSPNFRPFDTVDANEEEFAGYRWNIVSWREVQ
jgi:hypothetical protein